MITFSYSLGGRLRDELNKYYRRYNISEPEEVKKLSIHRRRDTFLESELEHITSLHVDEEVIENISLFKNVTSLHFDLACKLSQKDIQSVIDRFPNLTELSIIEQDDIQLLNLSNTPNLQDVKIIGNRNLLRVLGLDKLIDVFSFVFYDNIAYKNYNEMCKFGITHALEGAQIDLDVLAYPNMISVLDNDSSLKDVFEIASYNIKWDEAVGLDKMDSRLRYTTGQMNVAYKKALEICEKYLRESDSETLKYAILYAWMCENVSYDKVGVNRGHTLVKDGLRQGVTGGDNGTLNALAYGKCVCQGYTKALQLLTKVAGVFSFDVSCYADPKNQNNPFMNFRFDNERQGNRGDHSIQKVSLDGKVYYSDATWDASRIQRGEKPKYFLLSKRDILTTHELLGEDRVLTTNYSYSKEEQNALLTKAMDRIKQVDLEMKKRKDLENLRRCKKDLVNITKNIINEEKKYTEKGKK